MEHHIVVLGAGYAGIMAGTGIEFVEGRADGIDLARQEVRVGDRVLHYDTLVYAIGSVTRTGSVPGADTHAYTLDSPTATGKLAGGTVAGGGLTGVAYYAAAVRPTLLYLMKQVELATRARLDDLFRPVGMTALQYTALTVLERQPDLTSAQLARNSFVSDQAMAGMVTALEGRQLIERHRDVDDRRRLVLALTGEGRAVIARYRDEVDAIERQMLHGVAPESVEVLRGLLDQCRRNLMHGNANTQEP